MTTTSNWKAILLVTLVGATLACCVAVGIVPLIVGYPCIPDAANYSDDLQSKLPPMKGLIPGLIGLMLLSWGWINMRIEKHLPTSGVAFVVGCILWAYAGFIILPWSAR